MKDKRYLINISFPYQVDKTFWNVLFIYLFVCVKLLAISVQSIKCEILKKNKKMYFLAKYF